jgi:hypothetical protein
MVRCCASVSSQSSRPAATVDPKHYTAVSGNDQVWILEGILRLARERWLENYTFLTPDTSSKMVHRNEGDIRVRLFQPATAADIHPERENGLAQRPQDRGNTSIPHLSVPPQFRDETGWGGRVGHNHRPASWTFPPRCPSLLHSARSRIPQRRHQSAGSIAERQDRAVQSIGNRSHGMAPR